jgi:predicted HicB family RNase H-like nuclease
MNSKPESIKSAIRKRAAQYPKFVEWSEADKSFIGRCPTLFSGGVHGDDEADVYRQLCKRAEEWVALLFSDGSKLPRSRQAKKASGKFVVRIPPSLHERLALKALASGESLNQLVVQALMRA